MSSLFTNPYKYCLNITRVWEYRLLYKPLAKVMVWGRFRP